MAEIHGGVEVLRRRRRRFSRRLGELEHRSDPSKRRRPRSGGRRPSATRQLHWLIPSIGPILDSFDFWLSLLSREGGIKLQEIGAGFDLAVSSLGNNDASCTFTSVLLCLQSNE